ncbi:MAG: peptidoglycan-associated lipoprotein Pal [Cellvibrionaceae bacterium]
MVNNSLKQILGLACVLALMVGCATTSEEEMPDEPVAQEQPAPEPVAPEPEEMPELDTVFYFDFDSSVLKPQARAALTAHAERFKNNSQRIRLEGHADERGSREYNMALGERRANAVADFLVLQGVSRSRIETVSYGEERPARMGSNEAAWDMNRRVELN